MKLGANGEPDLTAMERILITDERHRARSATAVEHSTSAAQKHPLPSEARNGGAVTSDPNAREQIFSEHRYGHRHVRI